MEKSDRKVSNRHKIAIYIALIIGIMTFLFIATDNFTFQYRSYSDEGWIRPTPLSMSILGLISGGIIFIPTYVIAVAGCAIHNFISHLLLRVISGPHTSDASNSIKTTLNLASFVIMFVVIGGVLFICRDIDIQSLIGCAVFKHC